MSSDTNADFNSLSKFISRSASGFVIIVGLIVTIGWIFDIAILKSIYPTFVSMKANTAVAFILSGISLWFLIDEQAKQWKIYLAQVCAVIVALLGGLSLTQYLFGVDFGIDQLLFTEPVGAVETSHPGRMAPATALNFLFVGISLLLYSRKVVTIARVLITLVAAVALFSFLSYLFGSSSLRQLGSSTTMALHTSVTFIIFAVSLLTMKFVFDSQYIIRSGFWVAVVIHFYIGVISYWNNDSQIKDAKLVSHTHQVLQKLEEILSDIKDVETGVRGFVITGNEDYLEPYYAQYDSIQIEINELRQLTSDKPDQQRRIDLLEPIVKDKIAFMSDAITIRKTRGFEATVIEQYQTKSSSQLMDEIRVKIGEMDNEENRLLQERIKKSEGSSRNTMVTLVVGNIVSFILLVAIFMLLIRENRVRKRAELVSKQAEEEVRKLNAGLERRIEERTAELRKAYEKVQQNEERLRQTLDGMLEGVQIIGKDWRYRYINDAAAKHGGKLKGELVGHKIIEVYPGIENTEMFAVLKHCMDQQIPQQIENEFTYPDNTKGWFQLSIQPTPEGIFVLSIDITEQKLSGIAKKTAEKSLRESEQSLKEAQKIAHVGNWELDLVNNQLMWSDEIYRIFEIDPKKFGASYEAFLNTIHPDDRAMVNDAYTSSVSNRTKYDIVHRLLMPDGRIKFVHEICETYYDGEGKPFRSLGTVQDITQQRFAEQSLKNSEEKYRSIFESFQDVYYQTDLEGNITIISPSIKARVGYDPSELIGKNVRDFYADPVKRDTFMTQLLKHGSVRDYDLNLLRKDGSIIFVLASSHIIYGGDGKPIGIEGTLHDITERKKAEESLRKSQEQYQLITENVADMIAVLDLEGKRLYNNPAYKPILGDPKLLQGTDSFQEIHPDDREKIKRIFKEIVRTGIGQRAEYRFIGKDGAIHFIESQGSVIRDEKGNVSNVVVVSRDITEKNSLEQQLLRSQRMESIGTLAGGIAHDLNNVLAPIMLALEILRKKYTDADSQRMLETMETSAKRGSDIVKQVLAFGRGVEGEKCLLQPKHVVDEIVKIAQETFPKNIQLRKDIPKNLWVINADPTQMHQVLLNTFVNARDAMTSGGTITISAENIRLDENYARMHIEAKAGNYVLISVADTGKGIPPEILDRIFEPFFTTKEIGKGTGLGLSTVRSIIKSHGGFINVYSEKNKGTTFKFYLPAETKEHAVEEAEKKPELLLGNGELILVVDDEASIREITKATLEASGYRVATACDGTEALAVYAEKGSNIAVVITDMMMPFMDGVATIRALKRMNPSVKIIAASGRATNEDTIKEGDLAVHKFISKPYTAEVLLKVLREVITNI
ncbi:MAG: PAS domain S-box protein [Bacteroidota bacterium]|nr:PAS domain S-box protein [Bacteroidota bacterium]